MKKYLFAFDMDGTLLNSKDDVPQEIIDGIKKLNEMGHSTCMITGRSWVLAKNIYEKTGITTPAGVFNGGVVKAAKDSSFKTVVNYLSKDDVDAILKNELVNAHALNITIETKHTAYLTNMDSGAAKIYERWSPDPVFPVDSNREYEDAVSMLIEIPSKDEKFIDEISKAIMAEHKTLEVSSWYSHFSKSYEIEVTDKKSRKDHALKIITKHLGFDLKDTIAFGDGLNDKHMLMAAGKGIAMLNASDEVKSYADDVTTKTNEEFGVMDYIFNKILV